MRVLVLGGTGFIGPYVVRLLAAQGHDVTIFHRGVREPELPAGVRHVHGEFADLAGTAASPDAAAPDVVLDMVPFIDKGGHGITHFSGIANRAVAVTSCDVYRAFGRLWRTEPGPPDPAPLTEDSPLRSRPAADLGEQVDYDNVEVEAALGALRRLPVTILRLPATYGPGDPQHRLFPYLKRMDDGRPSILLEERLTRWRWTRAYVENVAAAIALAVQDGRAAGRVYNVAAPVADDEEGWVHRVGEAAGWHGAVVAAPRCLLPDELRLRHDYDFGQDYAVDSGRIRRELGYGEIVGEDEGLRRAIEWERRNPPRFDPARFDYDAEDRVLTALRA